MNKLILSISLLLSAQLASGQCNLYSKKDDFDGSITYWTKQVKIASDGVGILADQLDCKFRIFAHFVYGNNKAVLVLTEKESFCSCAPSSVTFKLANGVVITKSNLRQGPERSSGIGGESEHYSYFDLTKDELALLASQEIVKYRIREAGCTDHPVIESELSGKAARQIRDAVKCVLSKSK